MPCSDGGWGREEERQSYERQNAETQAKLDNVTRLLCEVCTIITIPNLADREDISISKVAGLKGWWVAHQKRDAEKAALMRGQEKLIQEEAERRKTVERALNKLTHEERKALKLQ